MRAEYSCRRASEHPLSKPLIVALVHVTFQPVLVCENPPAFPALAGASAPPLALVLQCCMAPWTHDGGHEFVWGEGVLSVVPAAFTIADFTLTRTWHSLGN